MRKIFTTCSVCGFCLSYFCAGCLTWVCRGCDGMGPMSGSHVSEKHEEASASWVPGLPFRLWHTGDTWEASLYGWPVYVHHVMAGQDDYYRAVLDGCGYGSLVEEASLPGLAAQKLAAHIQELRPAVRHEVA